MLCITLLVYTNRSGIISNIWNTLIVTVEEWDKIIQYNLRSTFLCFKHAAIQMIKQGRGGRIIG